MARKLEEVRQGMALAVAEDAAGAGLTAKDVQKERFAAHLTGGLSAEDAGREVGISAATAYRWAADARVKSLVKEWRGEVTDGLVRKLVRHGNVAIDTVISIMTDECVSAQTRLQAAFGVLDRLGLSPQMLAQQGNEGTQVVIEQFIQLNAGAADAQRDRALRVQAQPPAIEGEFKVV